MTSSFPSLHDLNSPSYSSYCIVLSCTTPAIQSNAQLRTQPTVLSNHLIPPNCTPATFVHQQSATTSQSSRQKDTKRRQGKALDRRGLLIGGKQTGATIAHPSINHVVRATTTIGNCHDIGNGGPTNLVIRPGRQWWYGEWEWW